MGVLLTLDLPLFAKAQVLHGLVTQCDDKHDTKEGGAKVLKGRQIAICVGQSVVTRYLKPEYGDWSAYALNQPVIVVGTVFTEEFSKTNRFNHDRQDRAKSESLGKVFAVYRQQSDGSWRNMIVDSVDHNDEEVRQSITSQRPSADPVTAQPVTGTRKSIMEQLGGRRAA